MPDIHKINQTARTQSHIYMLHNSVAISQCYLSFSLILVRSVTTPTGPGVTCNLHPDPNSNWFSCKLPGNYHKPPKSTNFPSGNVGNLVF